MALAALASPAPSHQNETAVAVLPTGEQVLVERRCVHVALAAFGGKQDGSRESATNKLAEPGAESESKHEAAEGGGEAGVLH